MDDRDVGEEQEWLTAELAELVESGARLGHDLDFVRHAPLETVATLLGVHAHAVDRARECLGDPVRRERLVAEYARASERPGPPSSRQDGAGEHVGAGLPGDVRAPAPASVRPIALRGRAALDVIGSAEQHPLGVQFLLCAPLETVAISFGVHPDVVTDARDELARRGIGPDA